jgi:hypothetical protein
MSKRKKTSKRRVGPIKHPGGLFTPSADGTVMIGNDIYEVDQSVEIKQAMSDSFWVCSLAPRLKAAGFSRDEVNRLGVIASYRMMEVMKKEAMKPATQSGLSRASKHNENLAQANKRSELIAEEKAKNKFNEWRTNPKRVSLYSGMPIDEQLERFKKRAKQAEKPSVRDFNRLRSMLKDGRFDK